MNSWNKRCLVGLLAASLFSGCMGGQAAGPESDLKRCDTTLSNTEANAALLLYDVARVPAPIQVDVEKRWKKPTGALRAVREIAWGADGSRFATRDGAGGVRIWDADAGQSSPLYKATGVTSICFHPTKDVIVTGGENSDVRFWNLDTQQTPRVFVSVSPITSIDLTRDGKLIAWGYANGYVTVSDYESGAGIIEFKAHDTAVSKVCFTPDGKSLVTLGYETQVDSREVTQYRKSIDRLAKDQDHAARVVRLGLIEELRRKLAQQEMSIKLWKVPTDELLTECQDVSIAVSSMALFPDGHALIAGNHAGELGKWRLQRGDRYGVHQHAHQGAVTSVCVFPDGRLVGSSGEDGLARIYDAGTFELKATLDEFKIGQLSMSPDGKTLVGAGSGRDSAIIVVWDVGVHEAGTKEPDTDEQSAIQSLKQLGAYVRLNDGGQAESVTVRRLERGATPEQCLLHLVKLPSLRRLTLASEAITERHVPSLAKLTSLERLDINFDKVSATGLKHLEKLRLKSLNVSANEVTGDALSSIGKVSTLEELDITFWPATDADLGQLKALQNLRWLEINGELLTETGVKHLNELPSLDSLVIFENMTKEKLERLVALSNLRFISLGDAPLPADGYLLFEKFPNLEHLDLSFLFGHLPGAGETDLVLANLTRLTKLRALSTTSLPITDKWLSTLKEMKQLEVLTLHATDIPANGIMNLGRIARLRELDLSFSKFDPAQISALAGLKNLVRLDLSHTSVSDASIPHLAKITSLRELRLFGTQISPQGADELRKLLPSCDIPWPR